ncbi:NAD(P)-dependent oxidoreductase [Sphingobium sp. H39-3-25]|uniref:NAD-dependent epimerase/dehydratase family protein n=1 Tax=Sphingobium arseniciresistens TaxID=3030834 RepID=UPI0023B8BB62|nr:NAD(P)-dependent oxidoreductase [Sphingobium arseniciresistens]
MRLLLTGSSGWLGRCLAPRLRAARHEVVGLDVAPGADTHVLGSVADKALIERVFSDHAIEAVIHGGALHKPDIARYPAQAFVDTNVTGTLNLLTAAVAAGHDRFVFTSTTSLMISRAIRAGKSGGARAAAWLDEASGPLEPRNIYGVTKLSAEHLCRLHHLEHGINIAILRTGRFFPEDDDMAHEISHDGPNSKANEFLGRRLTVEDAAQAHVVALDAVPGLGCETFILSAPTPFSPDEAEELMNDAPAVIARYFPDAAALYAGVGWHLPAHVDRVYDASKAERLLGFRCRTDFGAILCALRDRTPLPFAHDPAYVPPKETRSA